MLVQRTHFFLFRDMKSSIHDWHTMKYSILTEGLKNASTLQTILHYHECLSLVPSHNR